MKKKTRDIWRIIITGIVIANFVMNMFNNNLIKRWTAETKRIEKTFLFEYYTRGYEQAEKDFKLRNRYE